MAAENRLIDTNVLVYAYDVSEKVKRRVARSLLDEVWDQGGGVVGHCELPATECRYFTMMRIWTEIAMVVDFRAYTLKIGTVQAFLELF